MAKSAVIQARIEPELKKQGEAVLRELGLSASELVTLTYRQLVMRQGLPFDVKIPNAETLEAFREAENPNNLTSYTSVEEAFADIWDSE